MLGQACGAKIAQVGAPGGLASLRNQTLRCAGALSISWEHGGWSWISRSRSESSVRALPAINQSIQLKHCHNREVTFEKPKNISNVDVEFYPYLLPLVIPYLRPLSFFLPNFTSLLEGNEH